VKRRKNKKKGIITTSSGNNINYIWFVVLDISKKVERVVMLLRNIIKNTASLLILQRLLSSIIFVPTWNCKVATGSISTTVIAMRIVVQRVKQASVSVDNTIVSNIGTGIVALVGIHENDTIDDLQYCCHRLVGCKLFSNSDNKDWRQSIKQLNYECLLISQFTLYGTVNNNKQYKPDYKLAMKTQPAKALYEQFVTLVEQEYYKIPNSKNKNNPISIPTDNTNKIKNGIFGAMMDVSLINDGPVTIIIESNVTQQQSNTNTTTTTNNNNCINNNGNNHCYSNSNSDTKDCTNETTET
jgi:D-aminoacyl-tRNA deacylase